jgi:hypothetical protein
MEQQQEWQPKWGEDVYVWDSDDNKNEAYYVGANPNPKTKDKYPYFAIFKDNPSGGGGAYKHIRQIPPKPKTLREEVWDWLKQEGCSLSCDARIKLSHIIDRHEKGGENG